MRSLVSQLLFSPLEKRGWDISSPENPPSTGSRTRALGVEPGPVRQALGKPPGRPPPRVRPSEVLRVPAPTIPPRFSEEWPPGRGLAELAGADASEALRTG